MMAVQGVLLKSSVGVKVNCELREFAKSDGMPVYTIVGEVLLDNLDQLLRAGGRGWNFMF